MTSISHLFFSSKLILVALAWGLALILSIGLRFWGFQHPEPFVIRPLLVVFLLFAPAVGLGIWIIRVGFTKSDSGSLVSGKGESLHCDSESS
ncbi:MAG: hypothetical protein AB8A40_05105 [Prochlorococcus sp.]|nr:hypothetical protein [Prochlorococcaceae cyanobacterium ETNP14_MAG_4]